MSRSTAAPGARVARAPSARIVLKPRSAIQRSQRAAALGIAYKTVANTGTHIKEKLGAAHRRSDPDFRGSLARVALDRRAAARR
jgi:hypothetical protein